MSFDGLIDVRPDHPSLAGHFPGRPIVPGVVILDLAVEIAERHGWTISGIRTAKFHEVLEPAVQCKVTFSPTKQGGLQAKGEVDGKTVFTAAFDGRTS